MSKFALVTDSTAYVPAELVQKHNISVVPLILVWGDEMFEDGVDILPKEFYTRLKTAKVMPSTSQATPAKMQAIFQSLVDQGMDVLGMFISSKLSGTMQSAMQAKDTMGSAGEKVTLVDSQCTSMALGFQVLAAARAMDAGASLQECAAIAEKAHEKAGLFFAVDTLEFLHRGGRIGGAQRFIGSALNLKPILALKDGRVEGVERIRTKGKAQDRILELVSEKVKGKSNIRLATVHANAAEDAKILLDRAAQALNPSETFVTDLSPVVGTHAGPGTVGLAFMTD
ncbi:DegV family protein [Candidatus Villigracilis affinis]|uniref:DegV family protein n=1 Tax=Candidatus Villigracilis affinis TaxID=3140682 RepID=UPI001B743D49|nr:DegV family protein [Anaerolineales bacterium]MBL0348038.1 DegV family protein [Anaerolineales bacterium]MBP8047427.1 DegV family protein [Anaerolineales bacterium]